jgi:hypothetical protein
VVAKILKPYIKKFMLKLERILIELQEKKKNMNIKEKKEIKILLLLLMEKNSEEMLN